MKSRKSHKAYNARDLADASAFGWDFDFIEDSKIHELAELIAKARRRGEKRVRLLENAIAHAGYDVDAFVEQYRKAARRGEAFWR